MNAGAIMITVIGENIVDFIKQHDGLFKPHLGGSPFNIAVGVGRLGIPCTYLSPLSNDSFGDMFLVYLAKNNVQFNEDMRSDFNTSLAFVTLDEFQQPHYSIYRTHVADRDIASCKLINRLPMQTRILHTGSLALEPQDLPIILEVIDHARRAGMKISVDLNVRIKFISDLSEYIQGIKKIISLCDYIKASDEDLLEIFPNLPLDQSIEYVRKNMKNGIFAYTKGEHGAELITKETVLSLPVLKPTNFIDTIGAGDTFYAAFLSSIVNCQIDKQDVCSISKNQLHAVLQNAIVAASINVSRQGCEPPTRTELNDTLSSMHSDQDFLHIL
jgi:fructokinase